MRKEIPQIKDAMRLYHQGMSVTEVAKAAGLERLHVCNTIRNISRRADHSNRQKPFLKNREDMPIHRRGPGHPPGPTKRTLIVKEALKDVAIRLGGTQRLYEWVKEKPEHEDIFWSQMFLKLLPIELEATLHITHEQALDELERRFPRFVNGKPVKYLEKIKAPHIDPD